MTRVNLGIPIGMLCNQHCMSEYREMYRIFILLKTTLRKGRIPKIPKCFGLGTGHMKYFFNKGSYLVDRQHRLSDELVEVRKYSLSYGPIQIDDWPEEYRDSEISKMDIECGRIWLCKRINMSFNNFTPTWTNRDPVNPLTIERVQYATEI